ncbi:MAG TPA: efflux RND transporter permease subunit [Phycisphaerae bacterium]|jgi:multidrug efflux pump subunit AcrB
MSIMRSIVSTGVRNPVFSHLVMVCLTVGGVIAALRLVRETYPPFSLNHIIVDFVYPGASPDDCENVATRIEEAIAGVTGVNEVSSVSAENGGQVWLELRSSVRDPNRVLQDVKDRVDRISTLPAEVKRPIVSQLVFRDEVISVAVSGDAPERALRQTALDIKRELVARPEISQVTLIGVRDEEIAIEISEEALRQYDLSFREVIAAVARGSLDLPAGSLKTSQEEFTVRVKGLGTKAADYEDLVVISRSDGTLVRLSQVARVRDSFQESAQRGRFNGQPGVLLSVYKTPDEDGTVIAAAVKDYVARNAPNGALASGLHLNIWADTSKDLQERLDMITSNSWQAVVLVLITLAVFLNLRLAFFVSLDFPVVYAGTLGIMYLCGATINMITLFGLMMVAGMIVDDSNVIAEAVLARLKKGESPQLAAVNATVSIATPVIGSVAAVVAAFVPLFFVSGVMGNFISGLPLVIIAALSVSLLEAFLVLPAHLSHVGRELNPRGSRLDRLRLWSREKLDHGIDRFVDSSYVPALRWALRHRGVTLTLALVCGMLTAGWILGGHMPLVLLPKIDGNTLKARVRFPEGTPEAVLSDTVQRLEQAAVKLNRDPAVKPASAGDLVRQSFATVGEWSGFIPERGDNLLEVQIELMGTEQRRVDSERIIERWRALTGPLPEAVALSFSRQQLGPTDKPIEIRLHADSLDTLRTAADAVEQQLGALAGVTQVDDDLLPGKRELRVALMPLARTVGLTLEDVALQLRQAFFGGEAVRILRERQEVKVQVRYPRADRRSLADLDNMRLRTVTGQAIPFHEAARVDLVQGISAIRHQDGLRRARVWADIDEKRANAEQIIAHLQKQFLPELSASTPGLSYSIGGQHAQLRESLGSLFNGYVVSILAIYAIMAGLLGSYTQPLIIMATVPLGLTGAVVGHMLMGWDMTLMSLFGVVALTGVVVNNAIVMLDEVSKLRAEGLPVEDAIREGARSRFRPVTSTAITTVVGLLPMLTERSTSAQTLIPMCISLDFGLTFATFLTLLVVPATQLFSNDIRRFVYWLRRGGEYPARELVEASVAHAEHGEIGHAAVPTSGHS